MSKLMDAFAAQTSYMTNNVRKVPVPQVQTAGPAQATIETASTTYHTRTEQEIRTSVKFTTSVWVSEQEAETHKADVIQYVRKASFDQLAEEVFGEFRPGFLEMRKTIHDLFGYRSVSYEVALKLRTLFEQIDTMEHQMFSPDPPPERNLTISGHLPYPLSTEKDNFQLSKGQIAKSGYNKEKFKCPTGKFSDDC